MFGIKENGLLVVKVHLRLRSTLHWGCSNSSPLLNLHQLLGPYQVINTANESLKVNQLLISANGVSCFTVVVMLINPFLELVNGGSQGALVMILVEPRGNKNEFKKLLGTSNG